MSATVTVEFDDDSHITFYNVDDRDIDGMVDNYLHSYKYSYKV